MTAYFYILLLTLFFPQLALAAAKVQEVEPGVWLIEDHTLPIVTVRIAFEASGSAYDTKEGISSFVSQLLDEGAGDMDSLAFHNALERSAIHFNAGAGEDMFTVSLETLSQYKTQAFDLLHLALTKPRFDREAVERIRVNIVSNLGQMDEDPSYLAARNWKRLAFGSHPYAHPMRGNAASIAAITPEDLRSFAQGIFCQKRDVAIVGDITPAEAKAWAATLPPQCVDQPLRVIKDVTIATGTPAATIIPIPVPQTVVEAGLPALLRSDPRYYTLEVMNDILGGNSLTARLGKSIRDKRGLAYYAESDVETYDHAGYLSFHFATRNALAEEAVAVFLSEVKRMATGGVTQAELDDAKSHLTGEFPLRMDSQGALADYLVSIQHYHLGIDYLDKRNTHIEAVTLKDVNALAGELLSQAPLIVMAGQPQTPAKPAP